MTLIDADYGLPRISRIDADYGLPRMTLIDADHARKGRCAGLRPALTVARRAAATRLTVSRGTFRVIREIRVKSVIRGNPRNPR
jgi:hypothetical protein